MKALLLVAVPYLAISMHSCAPVPAVAPKGLAYTHAASPQLKAAGIREFEAIKRKKRISYNRAYNAQTQRVSKRLTRVIDLPKANWEFVVFEDSSPNAFALPGGKVGIHSGLFKITQNDAGLAAVLAHEIAHITRNHARSRRNQAVGLGIGGLVLDQIIKGNGASNSTRVALGTLYGAGAAVGAMLPRSRTQEFEADRVGTLYMAKAGYDPREAIKLWQRFAAHDSQKKHRSEFLSTHPLSKSRIQALQQFMPIAMREYNRR